jgi:hypothetical protein
MIKQQLAVYSKTDTEHIIALCVVQLLAFLMLQDIISELWIVSKLLLVTFSQSSCEHNKSTLQDKQGTI